jgi:hypothetical protein
MFSATQLFAQYMQHSLPLGQMIKGEEFHSLWKSLWLNTSSKKLLDLVAQLSLIHLESQNQVVKMIFCRNINHTEPAFPTETKWMFKVAQAIIFIFVCDAKIIGVQFRAITVKGNWIVVPLTLAVAVSTTLIVPSCVRSDPYRAIFVPSIWMKDGIEFSVYETESPQAGV